MKTDQAPNPPAPSDPGDAWFEWQDLGDGVTRILERFVSPEDRANIWLLLGRDAALLVDSGMGLRPLAPLVARLAERPVLCLSTHCHFDHAGGAHEFERRLSHPAEADLLAAPTRAGVMIERFVTPSIVRDAPPGLNFSAERYTIRPAPPTRSVDEGDVVDLGDRHLRVLHLPGHSPGSIGLLEESTGLFFSGDAAYDGELFDDYHHSSPPAYRETMRRLLELPVSTVHPGHYRSFGRDDFRRIAGDYLAGRRVPSCPADGRTP